MNNFQGLSTQELADICTSQKLRSQYTLEELGYLRDELDNRKIKAENALIALGVSPNLIRSANTNGELFLRNIEELTLVRKAAQNL